MMVSTASQMLNGNAAGQLPAGAAWHLDFINGFYYAGGEQRSIEEVLGGALDLDYLLPDGLDTSYDNPNRPEAIGPLYDDMVALLAAGQTMVVEIDGTINNAHFVSLVNNADPDSATMGVDALAQSNVGVWDWDAMFANGEETPITDQIHRIAFTFYRDIGGGDFESAISINGGAAVTDTTNYGGSFIAVAAIAIFHGWDVGVQNDGWVGRKMSGYPAKTPTELSALSALL